jgi:ABC-2 type transport system ATP-binding protein
MRELRDAGTAVLLSAHHLDLVERLADRFLLIARGRALLSGTLDEIRRAATGGRDESLVLELAGRDGAVPARAAVAPLLADAAPDAEWELRPGEDGRAEVEVLVRPGTALNGVLAALGARFDLCRVETRRLPLHDLYLRAVRADDVAPSQEAPR